MIGSSLLDGFHVPLPAYALLSQLVGSLLITERLLLKFLHLGLRVQRCLDDHLRQLRGRARRGGWLLGYLLSRRPLFLLEIYISAHDGD